MKDLHAINNAAIAHWSQAVNPAAVALWRRKMVIKNVVWRSTLGVMRFFKRVLDLIISLGAIIILSPIFMLIALAIYREDRQSVFFKQVRVGLRGKPFTMWKFRSMYIDAADRIKEVSHLNQHSIGITFKIKNDPRITHVGRFLRRTSLDELPQFFNVLSGSMSIVGPRPAIPREVAQYKALELRRLMTKPGITCLWQVSGRADIDFQGQVRLDLQYIRSESLWQDIVILFKTIPAVFLGRGAY